MQNQIKPNHTITVCTIPHSTDTLILKSGRSIIAVTVQQFAGAVVRLIQREEKERKENQ